MVVFTNVWSDDIQAMKIIDKQMIKKKLNMSTLRRPPTAGKPPGAAPAANGTDDVSLLCCLSEGWWVV